MSDGWGGSKPIYSGPVHTNLHVPPAGTVWVHDERLGWYPDCACHMPEAIKEMRKREAAEAALAAHRQKRAGRPVQPAVAADATETPIALPGPVEPPRSGASEDERAVHGLMSFLRGLLPKDEPIEDEENRS